MNDINIFDVSNLKQLTDLNLFIISKLKRIRIDGKFSENEMAEWLGISRSKFRRIESGVVMDFAVLIKYCEKFGTTLTIIANFDE